MNDNSREHWRIIEWFVKITGFNTTDVDKHMDKIESLIKEGKDAKDPIQIGEPTEDGLYILYEDYLSAPVARMTLVHRASGINYYPGSDQIFRGDILGHRPIPQVKTVHLVARHAAKNIKWRKNPEGE